MKKDKKDNNIEYMEEGGESFDKKYKRLKKLLNDCKKENAEYLDGWQRARAELQNRIKRSEEEEGEYHKFATTGLLLKLFPVLDNLQTAMENVPQSSGEHKWITGISYIKKQFEDVLSDVGVKEINPAKGEEFDPEKHEAVESVKSDEKPGAVVDVLERGYLLHGKAIRPARVKVAK